MNSRTFCRVVFAVFLSTIFSIGGAFAQEQSNAPAQPVPAASQTTSPNPSAALNTSGVPANGTQQTPAKRVWTDEDMGDLHRDSVISTFSGTSTKPAKPSGKPAVGAKNKDAKRYQDQIAALRAKLPPIDDKIAQLQGVLNGDTVQSTRTYGGNKIDDWHVELVNLQKQREDIETKVSALQDEARHNGVSDNQIPQ
jgi:hypothetical protein